MADLQSMLDTLRGDDSAFLPSKWLVDIGSEINICFTYKQFAHIGPSDVAKCVPCGSEMTHVEGTGVVH